MERGERFEMNPEIGKINDNLDKVKKQDTKNQKIDIDSPVKVGKDIKAKQADTADAGKNLRDKISDLLTGLQRYHDIFMRHILNAIIESLKMMGNGPEE